MHQHQQTFQQSQNHDMEKNGTPASPATALASNSFTCTRRAYQQYALWNACAQLIITVSDLSGTEQFLPVPLSPHQRRQHPGRLSCASRHSYFLFWLCQNSFGRRGSHSAAHLFHDEPPEHNHTYKQQNGR